MKKRYRHMSLMMMLLLIVTLLPINAFAAVKDDVAEPNTGRHYTVKEEVVADRRTNEYVYPIGQDASTATKRAFCYSEKHYVVYQLRVGDSDYRRKLYDEYHTTWHGEKKNASGTWVLDVNYPKKSEVSKDRSPLISILGILM